MINFKEEINKYKPITTMDEVEGQVKESDGSDVLELLKYLKNKPNNISENKE